MNPTAKTYLDLILNKPAQVGRWLGFEDLQGLHNDWIKMMLLGTEEATMLAHRGSYKTTCVSLAMALSMLLFPNRNIIFLRKTDDDIKEIVRQITKMLSGDVCRHLVDKLYGTDLKLVEATAASLTTNLQTSSAGHSQLFGTGTKSSLTGKHADLVITDDIVNLQDRHSRAERDLTKRVYMELQNIKNKGGRLLNIGTPWHKEDAISLMPNVSRFDCYRTGLIDAATLKHLRQTMTPSLFAANYELVHIAEADALFTHPRFVTNEKLLHGGIGHIDASYGGKDGTAYTIAKQRGDRFVMLGKRWNKHVDDCLPEIVSLHEHYRAGSISCEKNADKGYLAKALRQRGLYVEDYNEKMNKFVKISTYLRQHWPNIAWLDVTDPAYLQELLDYTEQAEHDDAPDSAASILRQWTKKGVWLL